MEEEGQSHLFVIVKVAKDKGDDDDGGEGRELLEEDGAEIVVMGRK